MTTNIKPKRVLSEVSFGPGGGMDGEALRDLAANHPDEFARKVQALVDSGDLRWDKVRSLPALFNRLHEMPIEAQIDIAGSRRSIQASAFPMLAGAMTVAGFNAALEAMPTIGQELVTEIESNKRTVTIAAITSEDTQTARVDEGKDFPEIGAGEEKYEIRSNRNGRRLSITAEMIEENDVPGIVQRINALGEIAGETIEEQTLDRVCDRYGSATSPAEPYVLRPNGSGAALYQTDNNPHTRLSASGNRIVNNALADESDLEAARARGATFTNSRGKRFNNPVSDMILLVPNAVVGTAMKLLNSEMVPGVANEISNWGPRGAYRPRLLSSPMLDAISTSAWYLGNFKKQFTRKWKLRMEYVTLGMDTESFLRSRLAFQARIAWDVEIGATDYVWVVQSLAASTAP